jgi:hypothetical protein
MNIRFSKTELELIYKILVRVKTKYNKSLDSGYSWINPELLDSLIQRFKFNLNDAFIKEIDNA